MTNPTREEINDTPLDPKYKDYRELMLGCGHSKNKRLVPPHAPRIFMNLTRLDMNEDCKPDIVFDLNDITTGESLTFDKAGQPGDIVPDNHFNEIHAYEVLEHVGIQGGIEQFFYEFREYWRILKPNGFLCATCPWWQSLWAWGDPGHRRVISPATLVFLDRREYDKQIGHTPMSDYRSLLKDMSFHIVNMRHEAETFMFILQAKK